MSIDTDDLRALQQALIGYDANVLGASEVNEAFWSARSSLEALIEKHIKDSDCDDCHGKKWVSCGQCSGVGYHGYESDPSYCTFCRHTGKIPCLSCIDARLRD